MRGVKERFRRDLGPKVSEGMRQLWMAMQERGWGFSELSASLGRRRGIVNKWLWGDRLPDVASAAQLEAVLGIPARLWAHPPTKSIERILPPLARSVLARSERRPRKPARPSRVVAQAS